MVPTNLSIGPALTEHRCESSFQGGFRGGAVSMASGFASGVEFSIKRASGTRGKSRWLSRALAAVSVGTLCLSSLVFPLARSAAAAQSGTLSYAKIEGYWVAAGGPSSQAATAAAITGAESGYQPGIIQQGQPYSTTGWGLWQITPGNSVSQFGQDYQILDPWNNAEAAVAKYKAAGNSFSPWTTYNNGAYRSFLQSGVTPVQECDKGQYVPIGSAPSGTHTSSQPGTTYGPVLSCAAATSNSTDVNGDGKADAIVVNTTGDTARLSNGTSFGSNQTWSGAFYGTRGNFFADVNGDGRADAIVVGDGGVSVKLSTGSGFGSTQAWTTNAYYGNVGTFFADVTGDGKADAIAVNNGGTIPLGVRPSTGSSFGAIQTWSSTPYYGNIGTYIG